MLADPVRTAEKVRGGVLLVFFNIVCLCFVGGGVREVGTACVVLDRLRCGGGFLFGGSVRFSRGSFSKERMLFSNVLVIECGDSVMLSRSVVAFFFSCCLHFEGNVFTGIVDPKSLFFS